jgi:phage FluMu gp28-like protein
MSAMLPSLKIDSDTMLAKCFMPHQIHWIQAEDAIHSQGLQAFALAEKSVRVGWTYADAFKNVRKRLRFKERDYLFATKDYPSALEYIRLCYKFAELHDYARAIVAHSEDYLKVPRLNDDGRSTGFMDDIKIGFIKFENGSAIRAFSSHPQAMAVYGGDVGLDEFAKHTNAKTLWETAQGRVTWALDMAVWSSHDGEDTLFNQFVRQARAGAPPWNLYYRVTIEDALQLGLLEVINRVQGTSISPAHFLAGCKARSGLEEVYQQSYMCNPLGVATASIVEWSAIERCRFDYQVERLHLESADVLQQFGQFNPATQEARQTQIYQFIHKSFRALFAAPKHSDGSTQLRLGFDVAASGTGDLAAIYIDEFNDSALWLRALLTVRTEDWHFLGCALFCFLDDLPSILGAGDESGLGRQICWEAANEFGSRFLKVNFAAKKQDLGFSLMNQLSVSEKRFPRSEQDIATDYFALRKIYTGAKWAFSEARNTLNPASHCDIAWAGALATYAHTERQDEPWALIC